MAAAAKNWTDDELTELKKLVTQNTPTPLIASKLGRSEDSIRSKAQAEGISLAPTNRSPAD
jgi:hypothetical protein